jgi:NAD(P)-dependent dehydrogenase (short-subunit alcohol dehydrogenase family)
MTGLAGRPILVTGAASGIGEATCERLAAEGARIALVDRDAERLEAVAARLAGRGARALALPADVSHEAEVRAAVEGAVATLGGLRGVVTSAGIFRPGDMQRFADVDLETFERTLAVNLTGTFLVVKHALPHLVREGGAIVTIASTAGLRGHGYGAGYTASKGGVIALTRLLAFQYGEARVRANCICPGATDTPMTGGVWRLPERVAQLKKTVPLGRAAEPREIGDVACFLLSDDASYLNGQVVAVDGGSTAQ